MPGPEKLPSTEPRRSPVAYGNAPLHLFRKNLHISDRIPIGPSVGLVGLNADRASGGTTRLERLSVLKYPSHQETYICRASNCVDNPSNHSGAHAGFNRDAQLFGEDDYHPF